MNGCGCGGGGEADAAAAGAASTKCADICLLESNDGVRLPGPEPEALAAASCRRPHTCGFESPGTPGADCAACPRIGGPPLCKCGAGVELVWDTGVPGCPGWLLRRPEADEARAVGVAAPPPPLLPPAATAPSAPTEPRFGGSSE